MYLLGRQLQTIFQIFTAFSFVANDLEVDWRWVRAD